MCCCIFISLSNRRNYPFQLYPMLYITISTTGSAHVTRQRGTLVQRVKIKAVWRAFWHVGPLTEVRNSTSHGYAHLRKVPDGKASWCKTCNFIVWRPGFHNGIIHSGVYDNVEELRPTAMSSLMQPMFEKLRQTHAVDVECALLQGFAE